MPSSIAKTVAAPVIGAVAGKVLGGKGEKQTSSSMPVLPENLKKGYDALIEGAMGQYNKPFTPAFRGRVEAPMTGMDALFASPEMLQIQRMTDANSYLDSIAPKEEKMPAALANNMTNNDILSSIFGTNPMMMNKSMGLGMPRKGQTGIYASFSQNATPEDYAAISQATQGATKLRDGRYVKDGQIVDLSAILSKYARG